MSINLSIFAPYRGVTGYDVCVRGFIKEWFLQGHNLKTIEFDKWSNTRTNTEIDSILDFTEKNDSFTPNFHLNFCLLDQAQINPLGRNAIYTMFESDKICKQWVDNAKKLDIVFVPTEWNKKVFVDSGIPEYKVKVCPVPLDIPKILHTPDNFRIVGCEGEDFHSYKHRFLNVSEFIKRKNVEGLLQVWCDETKPDDDACLLLKLNSNSGLKLDGLKNKIDGLIKSRKCAPIYLLVNFLTETQMLSLYKQCTHYITASYGEGWGLSESICGLLGKKVVAPNSSSFTGYLNDENAYLVKTNKVGAHQDGPTMRYYMGSNWFAPLQYSFRKKLRESISDANAGKTEKEQKLSARIKEVCDAGKVVNRLINEIKDFKPYPVRSKLNLNEEKNNFNWMMICKTLNTKCGIADYTMNLIEHAGEHKGKLFGDFMAVNGEIHEHHGILDDANGDIHVANIQLEYQFVSPDRLRYFIEYCTKANIVPVVTMHTVNPHAYDYHKVLKETRCPIIVSSEKMKDVLIENGFSKNHNIKVIPMGVSKENCLSNPTSNDVPTIGFFGFTYFHKGVDKLINYMAVYGADKACNIMSHKPENDRGYFDRIVGLFQTVRPVNTKWFIDWQEETNVVQMLSQCDVIFLPYSEYGGYGVSAAIRTCLKAGTPILTFENSFFKDVVHDEGLVEFISNKSDDFEAWSGALNVYMDNLKNMNKEEKEARRKEYISKRDAFLEKYNWDEISKMYINHFKDLLVENNQQ